MGPVTLNPLLNRFSSPKFSNLVSISTYLHHLPIPSLPTQSSPWRKFAGLIYPHWVIQGLPVLSNGVVRWWAPRDRRCLGLQLELGPSVEDVSMRNEAISSPIWAPSLSMIIITTPHPFFAIILKLSSSSSSSASPWTIITIVFILLLLLLLFTIIIIVIITFISTIMFLPHMGSLQPPRLFSVLSWHDSRCADTLHNKDALYQAKSIDIRPSPCWAVDVYYCIICLSQAYRGSWLQTGEVN